MVRESETPAWNMKMPGPGQQFRQDGPAIVKVVEAFDYAQLVTLTGKLTQGCTTVGACLSNTSRRLRLTVFRTTAPSRRSSNTSADVRALRIGPFSRPGGEIGPTNTESARCSSALVPSFPACASASSFLPLSAHPRSSYPMHTTRLAEPALLQVPSFPTYPIAPSGPDAPFRVLTTPRV